MRVAFLLTAILAVAFAKCPDKCREGDNVVKDCNKRRECKLEPCEISSKSQGLKCVIDLSKVVCPNKCKSIRRASNDCEGIGAVCALAECTFKHNGKKKRGYSCSKKTVLAPPRVTHTPSYTPTPTPTISITTSPSPSPKDCPGTCTTLFGAEKECRGTTGRCQVKFCPDTNSPDGVFTCAKVSPSPSPGFKASPKPCPFCSAGKFMKGIRGEECECVEDPCKACPDNTVCRLMQDDDTSFGRRRRRLRAICSTCDCGFCDGKTLPCCAENDLKCGPNPVAKESQCTVQNFEVADVAIDFRLNTCLNQNEILTARGGNNMLQVCACEPASDRPCVITRDNTRSACLVPRIS